VVKKIDTKIYILSTVATCTMIFIIFFISWYLNVMKANEMREKLLDFQLTIEDSQLEMLYIANYMKGDCSVLESGVKTLSERLVENNRKLSGFDSSTMSKSEYDRLKAEHILIFAKLWLLYLKMKNECNSNISTILYFFSINSDECIQQGYVLDSLYNKYSENLFIFPIDADFDLGIIKILKERYNVTQTPTIIVNEKIKFVGLTPKDKIEPVLFNQTS